ncbi:C39 family peptidase [Actinomadura sp. HBU206391]|uniref:C39 family peptidase n=1 Tax=Actinomadura sp. HBU206391 TaxID=2731692 RepID=UPI00164FE314|nr:C39 family peptidase [Actinomadura sp. HBU206391]MBC6457589.1 C39 family peptidase [Actinomadura sp. HBU206391]
MKRWTARAAMALAVAAGAAGVVQTAAPQTATAATTATPPGSVRSPLWTAPDPATVTAPPSYRLTLQGQYQRTDYYCMPASASMSLSTFGVKVKQAKLARAMRTTTTGTRDVNAIPVLRSYVKSLGYKYTAVPGLTGRPKALMKRVAYDVGMLHRAPNIDVWMEMLPWNKGEIYGTRVGHIMVVYGYDQKKGTITVFDPWKPTGGTHTLSAATLADTLQDDGSIHYISRI